LDPADPLTQLPLAAERLDREAAPAA
jgi:hypothetical protein